MRWVLFTLVVVHVLVAGAVFFLPIWPVRLLVLASSLGTAVLAWKTLPAEREFRELKGDMMDIVFKLVTEKTDTLHALLDKREQESLTDPLTGLLNRRGGEQSITRHVARSRRVKTAISFLIVDIDNFKKINDTYGHLVGDLVLCTIAETIKTHTRTADVPVRWGGEEILVCLPDTDIEGSIVVADKIRTAIADLTFEGGMKATVSIGAAEVMGVEDFWTAIARADMNLYIAKARGRNRVFPLREEKTS